MSDVLCCLIFSVFIIALIGVCATADYNMKFANMFNPVDSDGNVCGVDSGFEDYKYAFLANWNSPMQVVCVKTCPIFKYEKLKKFLNSPLDNQEMQDKLFSQQTKVKLEKGHLNIHEYQASTYSH